MASLLKIDGVEITSPTTYNISTEALGNWERNNEGELVGDLIAIKKKISLTWNVLPDADFKILMGMNKPFWKTVDFYCEDGASNATMYSGPQSASLLQFSDTKGILWKDVSFNLIEK